MRHTFKNIITLAMSIICVSCSNDIVIENTSSSKINDLKVTVRDFQYNTGRSDFDITDSGVQFKWEANDTIGIFPDQGAQAFYTITEGDGTNVANFTGGGWALKQSSTYAAYYPFVGDFYLDPTAIPINYNGQTQIGNNSTAHLGKYDFLVAKASTPNNDNVRFEFQHVGALIQVNITCPKPTKISDIYLISEENIFLVRGSIDISDDKHTIKKISSSNVIALKVEEINTTSSNEIATLNIMIPPTDLSEKRLKLRIMCNGEPEDIDITGKNFESGNVYSFNETLTYNYDVITLNTAGTLRSHIKSNSLNISKLKVIGPINGDDFYLMNLLCNDGKLRHIDLSEATIVDGGEIVQTYKNILPSSFEYAPIKNIYLPNGIEFIGNGIFRGCDSLETVFIPNGVKRIEDYAFNCSIKNIYIPRSLTYIGKDCFHSGVDAIHITDLESWCNLNIESSFIVRHLYVDGIEQKEITIPYGLTSLRKGLFMGCVGLTSVKIPNSVNSIKAGAFQGCSNLKYIGLSENLTSIGSRAFHSCSSLKAIYLTDKVDSIHKQCFLGCNNLESLYNTSGITYIGESAFYCCDKLKSIQLPKIKTIGPDAFSYCYNLTSITLGNDEDYEYNIFIDIYAFRSCYQLSSVIIPGKVKEIMEYAFFDCRTLSTITIDAERVNIRAFKNCDALSSIFFTNNTPTTWSSTTIDPGGNNTFKHITLYIPFGMAPKYTSSTWYRWLRVKEVI